MQPRASDLRTPWPAKWLTSVPHAPLPFFSGADHGTKSEKASDFGKGGGTHSSKKSESGGKRKRHDSGHHARTDESHPMLMAQEVSWGLLNWEKGGFKKVIEWDDNAEGGNGGKGITEQQLVKHEADALDAQKLEAKEIANLEQFCVLQDEEIELVKVKINSHMSQQDASATRPAAQVKPAEQMKKVLQKLRASINPAGQVELCRLIKAFLGGESPSEFADKIRHLVDEHQVKLTYDEAGINRGKFAIWFPPTAGSATVQRATTARMGGSSSSHSNSGSSRSRDERKSKDGGRGTSSSSSKRHGHGGGAAAAGAAEAVLRGGQGSLGTVHEQREASQSPSMSSNNKNETGRGSRASGKQQQQQQQQQHAHGHPSAHPHAHAHAQMAAAAAAAAGYAPSMMHMQPGAAGLMHGFGRGGEAQRIEGCPLCSHDPVYDFRWGRCTFCQIPYHEVCVLHNRHAPGRFVCPREACQRMAKGTQQQLASAASLVDTPLGTYLTNKAQSVCSYSNTIVVKVVADTWKRSNHPLTRQFPYRFKTVFTFQKVAGGGEVMLFGMYIHEFGAESFHANQGRAYLQCLDSTPLYGDEKGRERQELLTAIICGYFEFARSAGFDAVHLHVPPPTDDNSFVFTNRSLRVRLRACIHLADWYHRLLETALCDQVITGFQSARDCTEIDFPTSVFDPEEAAAEAEFRSSLLHPPPLLYAQINSCPQSSEMLQITATQTKRFFVVNLVAPGCGQPPPEQSMPVVSAPTALRPHLVFLCQMEGYSFQTLKHGRYSTMMLCARFLEEQLASAREDELLRERESGGTGLAGGSVEGGSIAGGMGNNMMMPVGGRGGFADAIMGGAQGFAGMAGGGEGGDAEYMMHAEQQALMHAQQRKQKRGRFEDELKKGAVVGAAGAGAGPYQQTEYGMMPEPMEMDYAMYMRNQKMQYADKVMLKPGSSQQQQQQLKRRQGMEMSANHGGGRGSAGGSSGSGSMSSSSAVPTHWEGMAGDWSEMGNIPSSGRMGAGAVGNDLSIGNNGPLSGDWNRPVVGGGPGGIVPVWGQGMGAGMPVGMGMTDGEQGGEWDSSQFLGTGAGPVGGGSMHRRKKGEN
jgi:hypothetical protein